MKDYLKIADSLKVENELKSTGEVNPYNALADTLEAEEQQNNELNIGMNLAQDVDADKEAKVYDLSRKTKTPPDVTRDRLREIERRQKIIDLDVPKQIKDYPAVSEELKKPDVSSFIHDDVAQLNTFERIARDTSQKLQLGSDQKELTDLNWELMHERGNEATVTQRDNLSTRVSSPIDYRLGWFGTWPGDVAQEGAKQAEMLQTAYQRGSGAGHFGASVTIAAFVEENFKAESANAWQELSTATDETGLPVGSGVARVASYLVGAGAIGLEIIPVKKVLNTIPGAQDLFSNLTSEGMKKALKVPSVRKAFMGIAKRWGEAAVWEAVQEGVTELLTMGAGEIIGTGESPLDQQAALMDASKTSIALSRFGEAAEMGFKVGGGFATPGTIASMVNEGRHVRNAFKRADMYREMGETAQNSKTRERLPKKFQEIIKNINDRYGVIDDIYVDSAKLNTFFQGAGVTPDMIAENMPGLSERLSAATELGTDVAIPLDEFSTYIASSESFDQLVNDLRPHPEALTANEAMEMQQEHNELLKAWEIFSERQEKNQQAEDYVYEDMRQQLEAAGQAPDIADKQAQLISKAVQVQAGRQGIDPVEYYKNLNLSIVSELAQEPGREAISPIESALNAVREGLYPTEKEMFGDSLTEFIKSSGGMVDEGGELSAMDPGGRGGLINKKGKTLADFTELARDADYGDMDENQLLDAIRDEQSGTKRYAMGQENQDFMERKRVLEELSTQLDEAGLDVDKLTNEEILAELTTLEQPGYHGTPHAVDKFRTANIGTGEGLQAYGWGLYFASRKEIADSYREALSDGIIIQEFQIGGLDIYSGESPADYSRYDPTTASFVEDLMIEEWKIKEAFDEKGEAGVKEFVLDTLDEHVERWEEEAKNYPEDAQESLDILIPLRDDVRSGDAEITFQADKTGNVYKVEIPEDTEFLDWDTPVNEQTPLVSSKLAEIKEVLGEEFIEDTEFNLNVSFEEWTGEQLYKVLQRFLSEEGLPNTVDTDSLDKQASDYLYSLGIKGNKYLDGGSRSAGDGTYNYVIFHEDDIEIIKQYNQGAGSDARGNLTFPTGKEWFKITLTGNANLSTFLHESGHLFLEMLRMSENVEGVSEQAKVDMDAVREWLGAKEGQELTTEQHEQFARGFEKYLFEGKAPSTELKSIFQSFKAWLTVVYRKLANLGVELNDDIRSVFDRLLATQDEIDSAVEDFELMPVFEMSDMMSPEAYVAYVQSYNKAIAAGRDAVDRKFMTELAKTKTDEYKKQEKKVRAAIEDQWNTRQDANARSFLRSGKMLNGQEVPDGIKGWKLSTSDLKAIYPDGSVNKRLVGMHRKDGVSPDLMASALEFSNGTELLQSILSMPTKKDWIAFETDRAMKEDYGDMLSDGTLEVEAAAAVHRAEVSAFLHAELKALSGNRAVTPLGIIKRAAQEAVRTMRLIDFKPHIFRAGEVRWSKEAQRLVADKDFEGAAEAKRKQLMNHYMFAESLKAKERINSTRVYLSKFDKKSTRERLGKASGGDYSYIAAIDSLLTGVDLKKATSVSALTRRGALDAYIQNQEEQGNIVAIPEYLREEARLKSYKLMTLEELEGLRDAVKNIEHMARLKNKMQDIKDRRDFKESIGIIVEGFETNFDAKKYSKTRNKSDVDKYKEYGASVDAFLTKIEFTARQADGGEQGPVHDLMFEPMAQAQHQEYDMLEEIGKPIVDAMKNMSKEQKTRLSQKYEFQGEQYTGFEVVAIALNMGNEGNMDKMLRGEDWSRSEVDALLDRVLRKEDWDFAQNVWDTIDLLWPHLAALEKRVTGLVPPKVQAIKIDTPYGTYKGGYYPVKYDPDRKSKTGKNNDRIFLSTKSAEQFFEKDLMKKGVDGGMAETRTKYAGPILFSLDVIPQHIFETIHYVTHYEPVRNINRILNDRKFRETVTERMGKSYLSQMNNWLANIANDRRQMDASGVFNKTLRHLRMGSTVLYLGFRAWTGIAQTLGLFTAADEIGGKWTGHGIKKLMTNPKKVWAFADENSGEIRHAVKTFDREMRLAFDNTMRQGKFKYGPEVARMALLHIGYIQKSVNIATWTGAYDKYISSHPGMAADMAHAEAVKEADAVVRVTQSGGGAKDLAPIQFGDESVRLFSAFYTYFSVLYNREKAMFKNTRNIKDMPKAAASLLWLIAMPYLMEEVIKGSDDDMEWNDHLRRMMLYGFTGLPLGRDVMNVASGESRGISFAALQPLESVAKAANKARKGDFDETFFRNLVYGVGGVLRLPTKTAWDTAEALKNVLSGNSEDPVRELLIKPER